MGEQKQGGLEAVVSEKPMQKKRGLFWKKLPYKAVSAVCAIGLGISIYMAGMAVYKGTKEVMLVQKSNIITQDPDEPSPYSGAHVYGIMLGMVGIGGTAFGFGLAESIKKAREE